jgi:hypothetical protein
LAKIYKKTSSGNKNFTPAPCGSIIQSCKRKTYEHQISLHKVNKTKYNRVTLNLCESNVSITMIIRPPCSIANIERAGIGNYLTRFISYPLLNNLIMLEEIRSTPFFVYGYSFVEMLFH